MIIVVTFKQGLRMMNVLKQLTSIISNYTRKLVAYVSYFPNNVMSFDHFESLFNNHAIVGIC